MVACSPTAWCELWLLCGGLIWALFEGFQLVNPPE